MSIIRPCEQDPGNNRPIDHDKLRANRLERGGRSLYGTCPKCGRKLYHVGRATDTGRDQYGCTCGYHHAE